MTSSLKKLMQHRGMVFGVAIINDSEIVSSRVVGAPPDRLFQAGSISKPVTAFAALELAARGEVDLDADVNERLVSWQVPGSRVVSLRRLLGHTSGLGASFLPGYVQGVALPTLRQVLDGEPPSVTQAVVVDPAAYGRFRYSGGGYAVVQQLIADVTGVRFAEAARNLVLEPLGMQRSTFDQPLPNALRTMAARDDWHVYPESAAAGLWTTPDDLARFACALQAAQPGQHPNARSESVAWMLGRHVALPAKGEWNVLPLLGVRPPDAYGLGMFRYGEDRFGHLGGAASFFSALTASRHDGTGAIVMTAAKPSLFLFKLLRAISDENGWIGYSQPTWKRLHGLPGVRRLVSS